jgi:hypothetical protein
VALTAHRQVGDKNFAISPIATNVYFERKEGQSVKEGSGGEVRFPGALDKKEIHERKRSRTMRTILRLRVAIGLSLCIAIAACIVLIDPLGTARTASADSFFGPFLPLQVSTIPSNGDTTPYGLAFVPDGFPNGGAISRGELLVSNFNNTTTAGQGTTIITVNPNTGQTGLFFQGTSPIGFTNALTIARAGLVFAGSLPTSSGTPLPVRSRLLTVTVSW